MSRFSYDTIPFSAKEQIRIFTLSPSVENSSTDPIEHDALIKGSLESVNWTDKPEYTALSYTWGNDTPLRTILIKGRQFEITANLHDALSELRQKENSVRLWIDAICINQKDNSEKNEQVMRMTDIYKEANSVFAWLGCTADDSDTGMKALRSIGDDAIGAGMLELGRERMLKLWDPDPEGLLASVREPFENLSKTLDLKFPQLAIKCIEERSYWERTWIVQEFSVAPDLVIACGEERLSFPQLCAGILFLGMHVTLVGRNSSDADLSDPIRGPLLRQFFQIAGRRASTSRLIGSRRRYQKQTATYHSSLMELLSLFSNSLKATDPRDRIYGILGLAPDKKVLDIKVDYQKEVHEVYTEVAKTLLMHNYTDILSWCQFPKGRPGLPSWVPNFSVPLREPYGSYKTRAPPWKPLFNATLDNDVKISTQSSLCKPNNIVMSGFRVDTIKKVGTEEWTQPAANWFWPGVQTFLTEIKQFLEQAQMLPKPLIQDQNFWDEAFWRIPCADQEYHGYARRRAEVTAEDGLCEVIARMYGNNSGYHDEGKKAAFSKYDGAMGFLYGVRPFLSEKGYVGLAPKHALPGDKVCVILGAIVPYVLRRVGEEGFELVGEAYVHGIMDGEAMDLGLEEEQFCLL
jgi:hypothetical protein